MRFTQVTLLAVLSVTAGIAADRPNLSGDWKLNLTKSDLGEMPAPDSWMRKIQHQDAALSFATIQERGDQTLKSEFRLTTDGKEASFQMGGGNATGSASWDGSVLVLKTKRESQVGRIIQNERASLSADGRILTFDVDINIQERDVKMKLVFEKQ